MICVPDPDLDPRASGISFATQKGSGAVADSLIRAAEQPRMLIAVPITYHTLKRPSKLIFAQSDSHDRRSGPSLLDTLQIVFWPRLDSQQLVLIAMSPEITVALWSSNAPTAARRQCREDPACSRLHSTFIRHAEVKTRQEPAVKFDIAHRHRRLR